MKKIGCILLIAAMTMGMAACGGSNNKADDAVDQVANVVQADDENVLFVKEGTNSNYSDVTYGEAFEAFFKTPTWKYFKGTKEGPDDDGDGQPDYTEDNIDVVEFTGYCTYSDVEVKALIQFELDKDAGTFEASYLSFNDVPQSSLMLGELINTVFENYMEENGMQSNTGDTQVNNADTSSDSDNVSDNANSGNTKENSNDNTKNASSEDYNYEALAYAGSYENDNGYKISFSAYSSVEGNEIGSVEIYQDGSLVDRSAVYIAETSGDWDPADYSVFYETTLEGDKHYLAFYKVDGVIWLDYNSAYRNIESLAMTEHYES